MRLTSLALAAVTALSSLTAAAPALADSCWWHNGSLMRLQAQGQNRWFSYESPRPGLPVAPGTLLFNGQNQGGWYTGIARVFSSSCPGAPLEYAVSGPVGPNQTTVTMQGQRPVRQNCQFTGGVTQDTLYFTYSHQC